MQEQQRQLDRRIGKPRVDFHSIVRLNAPDREHSVLARAINLSEGGLYINTSELFNEGTQLQCDVPVPRSPQRLNLRARVAWTQRTGDLGMGIEFIDLSNSDSEILKDVVQQGQMQEWTRPVHVWFEGAMQPVAARATPTENGTVLLAELDFLRLNAPALISYGPGQGTPDQNSVVGVVEGFDLLVMPDRPHPLLQCKVRLSEETKLSATTQANEAKPWPSAPLERNGYEDFLIEEARPSETGETVYAAHTHTVEDTPFYDEGLYPYDPEEQPIEQRTAHAMASSLAATMLDSSAPGEQNHDLELTQKIDDDLPSVIITEEIPESLADGSASAPFDNQVAERARWLSELNSEKQETVPAMFDQANDQSAQKSSYLNAAETVDTILAANEQYPTPAPAPNASWEGTTALLPERSLWQMSAKDLPVTQQPEKTQHTLRRKTRQPRYRAWLWLAALAMTGLAVASMVHTKLWPRVIEKLLPLQMSQSESYYVVPLPTTGSPQATEPQIVAEEAGQDIEDEELAAEPKNAPASVPALAPKKKLNVAASTAKTAVKVAAPTSPVESEAAKVEALADPHAALAETEGKTEKPETKTEKAETKTPEISAAENEISLTVPLSGSTEKVEHYQIAGDEAVGVNLPNAQAKIPYGVYPIKQGGIRMIWVRQRDNGGVHVRVFFSGATPEYRLNFDGHGLKMTVVPGTNKFKKP